MDNKIHLLVSTNGGTVLDTHVNYVLLPLEGGDYGILAGHAPLIGSLKIGIVKYTIDKDADYLVVTGGVVSVNDNQVTILARSAEKADEIDLARAQASEKRAMDRRAEANGAWDKARLEASLQRAQMRKKACTLKQK